MFAASHPGQAQNSSPPTRQSGPLETGWETRKIPYDAPEDLLHLEDFTDGELLRALWTRYQRKEIYTWVGSVLVSVNPYRDIGIFRDDVAAQYASNNPPQAPHLYATVRAALNAPGKQHALLITGESGAGKTEATRAVLSFLALRHTATDYIRDRLLKSTPVLEAFGNAHTRQNTNSSRFGKFIEVYLSNDCEVVGAALQPYMLEASRVSGDLPQGERTYHVFYLLRAALATLSGAQGSPPKGQFWTRLASSPEWAGLARTASPALTASTRLQGGPPDARCLECFQQLFEGLLSTGMQPCEVAECSRVVAAVSLLSDAGLGESAIATAASLLRIPQEVLVGFFTTAEMSVGTAGRERLQRARSGREVATLRASFAQELYTALFGWLTRLIARGIAPPTSTSNCRLLGLLDLYGFEVFSSNGFEQFLINYCNERLQQFFNRQVFMCEAEEYAAEGLDTDGEWWRLTAACQLPALSFLEGEPGSSTGAFGVINDRSRCGFEASSGGEGCALAEAVAAACGGHAAFRRAPRNANRVFGIAHFAGTVYYEAAQFVRKNASAHRPDIAAFLRQYGSPFVRSLAGDGEGETDAPPVRSNPSSNTNASGSTRRKLFGRTLITVFREELNELCAALEARQCRHVRCLRPNDEQASGVFNDDSMLRQCRYSGLLEAARIRRQGYAHRRPLRTFAARYAFINNSKDFRFSGQPVSNEQAARDCAAICRAASRAGIAPGDACVGRTKVFLRETALMWLEATRTRVAAGKVLALLRGHHAKKQYERLSRAVLLAQACARGRAARARVWRLKAESRAAEERAAAEKAAEAAAAAARAALVIAHKAAARLQRWWRRRFAQVRAARWQQEQSERERSVEI